MRCGWEGNRRSGVALAMRHRLQWFIRLRAHGLRRRRDEHPACALLVEYGPFTFTLGLPNPGHDVQTANMTSPTELEVHKITQY